MVVPTDLYRVFIQSLISRRFMREEIALELYKRAVDVIKNEDYDAPHDMDSNGLSSFMQEITMLLHDFGLEVKRGREDTKAGKLWYALVNTESTGVATFASDYSPNELTFFRELVSEIVDSYPAYSVGSLQALRLANAKPISMPKSQAQSLLTTFVARGYLVQSKRGRFAIGPRGILELETYLGKETNASKCDRCKKLVFVGKACSKDGCDAHFHLYCYNTVIRRSNLGAACPACRTSFEAVPPREIGEKAVARVEDDFRESVRKRKRVSRPSGGTRRDNEEDDEEDELDELESEEEDADETQAVTQRAGPSQRAGRRSVGQPSYVPETQLEGDD